MKRFMASLALLAFVALGQGYIGRLDTIGSTTYDWQNGWHAMQMLVNAPGHGLHAVWMWSASTSGSSFPDRNMWYNYYDFATRRWMWPDSNPMHGGVRVFTHRAGSGNVDVDPAR